LGQCVEHEIALVVLLPLAFLAYLTFVSTVIVSAMIFIERVFDLFKRR